MREGGMRKGMIGTKLGLALMAALAWGQTDFLL